MSANPESTARTNSEPKVRWSELLAVVERESAFYREQLELICQDPRKTRARRLAESALMFWDQMQYEASKRKAGKTANSD